jgi:hypothetical protein
MSELAYSESTPRLGERKKKSNGFRAIAWARDVDVSGHEKALLLVLASHANGDDEAFPHVETLANGIRASVRTTYRALANLVKAGHIIRKRTPGTVHSVGLKFQGMSASMFLLGHRSAIRSRVCWAQA